MDCLDILELNPDKIKSLTGYFFCLAYNDQDGLTDISNPVLCQAGLVLFYGAK